MTLQFNDFTQLIIAGLFVGFGIAAGIRIFDWIMQEIFHEGEGHHE